MTDLFNLLSLDNNIPGPLHRSKLIHSKTSDPSGSSHGMVNEEDEEEEDQIVEVVEALPPKKEKPLY
jgi:hypothetical protein